MNKLYKILFGIILLLTPTIALASDGSNGISVVFAIFIEIFISFHFSIYVFKPLSKLLSPNHEKEMHGALFIIRAVILFFFDFYVTTSICIADFLGFFVGVIVLQAINKKTGFMEPGQQPTITIESAVENKIEEVIPKKEVICPKCNIPVTDDNKFCTRCGTRVRDDYIYPYNFDPIYMCSEEMIVKKFINNEITKAGINFNEKIIPIDALKRKNILSIIFSVLLFVYISLIFFHFPIMTYIIGFILLLIFFFKLKKFNYMKYLYKQVKARPGEKISNIVMSIGSSLVKDTSKNYLLISLPIIVILTCTLFWNPRILYENKGDEVAVRYYIFGISNYSSVTIPESYKGKKVVTLRGNAFSNMFFLEHVSLPDTITEIRGQAFKNDKKLKEVKLPSKLEYLGGGAFYNCSSLKKIELPDTLTYLGGESFFGAKNLESIKLSINLKEIRGNTFENCTSLTSIEIPDSVTKIGAHAFYSCTSLSEVSISKNSKLKEIGSSAFRLCTSLRSITIPKITKINERAFKESPTKIKRYGGMYNG